jgi:hypothetical protein
MRAFNVEALPFYVLAASLSAAAAGWACGHDEPALTSPAQDRFRLSGSVARSNQTPIAGASVLIVDGPAAGSRTTTDSRGAFSFPNLTPATFAVHASADSYVSATRRVTLAAADLVVEIILSRADLALEGVIRYNPLPHDPATVSFDGDGINRGDACASNVTGLLLRVDDEGEPLEGQTRAFALAPSLIVHPLERFAFGGCCYDLDEVETIGFARAEFSYQSVSCR